MIGEALKGNSTLTELKYVTYCVLKPFAYFSMLWVCDVLMDDGGSNVMVIEEQVEWWRVVCFIVKGIVRVDGKVLRNLG